MGGGVGRQVNNFLCHITQLFAFTHSQYSIDRSPSTQTKIRAVLIVVVVDEAIGVPVQRGPAPAPIA